MYKIVLVFKQLSRMFPESSIGQPIDSPAPNFRVSVAASECSNKQEQCLITPQSHSVYTSAALLCPIWVCIYKSKHMCQALWDRERVMATALLHPTGHRTTTQCQSVWHKTAFQHRGKGSNATDPKPKRLALSFLQR